MSRRVRDVSETSATATVDHTSMSETTSVRSGSPTASIRSAATTGNPSDVMSIATTTQTGYTNTTGITANTSVSQQQPRFDAVKAMFTQADANRDGSISREEFRHWVQPENQTSGQFHQQQNTQFSNQNFHTSFSGHSSQDTTLFFDYSVMEAYNVGYQSASDINASQLSGGFEDEKKFDAVKAMFNQADVNHDGGISRDEFRQWAQGAEVNSSEQSYSSSQTTTNFGQNFNHGQLFEGASPEVANILHQSGLGQGITNYS